MMRSSARLCRRTLPIAFKDMVQWVMEKTGMGMLDSYQFVSQNAVAPIIEIVDPLYTVLVKIPKSRLPK
jgi:acetamidase/formamidase